VSTAGKTRTTTLAAVRKWPPTISVDQAARALGISRPSAYRAVADGTFPAETIRVGRPGRLKVITADIVRVLEGRGGRPA
jgi:excisionase family DNA binding protein